MPLFKTEYFNSSERNRLFVIHLMGSHPNASERVADYPKIISYPDDKDIECYMNSIHKTDSLIKKIYQEILQCKYKQNIKETFSLVYFSDHGVRCYEKGEMNIAGDIVSNTGFFVDDKYKESYEVPLFRITNNDTINTYIKARKYGKNFTRGLANWMGIKSSQIKEDLNLFSLEDDTIIDKSLKLEERKLQPFTVVLKTVHK
ncbi:MAG: sulfatase-like hydrolase/transferase [Dysgonomonas sp.]